MEEDTPKGEITYSSSDGSSNLGMYDSSQLLKVPMIDPKNRPSDQSFLYDYYSVTNSKALLADP